jgi:DNA-binding response OmpR family regulator
VNDAAQPPLADQLSAIWARFRDATLARVDQLDAAVTALREHRLAEDARMEAAREAHKLAGSSGTFGFPAASLIARDLEQRFKSGLLTGDDVPALSEQLAELRAELEGSPRPPALPIATPPRSTRAFLLLIDDEATATECVMKEASRRGFDVVQAVTAREGEQLLRARRPDAVLIDLRHSGAETPRLIDALRALTPPVPTLVVLHDGASHDRVDLAQRGVRRCLDAPIAPELMIDAVDAEWRHAVETRGTVLAVDDDPRILEAVRELLRARGLNVVVLSESSQFWQALEASAPDLLLLDIEMPGVTGLEISRGVRENKRWAHLPIVFLTARSDAATREAAFASGSDGFLPKPIDAAQLLALLDNQLERARLERQRTEIDAASGIGNRERSVVLIERFLQLAARTKEPAAFAVVSMNANGASEREADMFRALARTVAVSTERDEIVARWDAREIVVASYGLPANVVVERLRRAVADFAAHEFHGVDGSVLRATAWAGIAECPADGTDVDTLVAVARSVVSKS